MAPAPAPRYVPPESGEQQGGATGEAVALEVADTPFVLRAAGAAIDLLALGALAFVVVLVVGALASEPGLDSAASAAVTVIALVLCLVVVPVLVETASRGRSLGRLAVGARIVREDGGAISFRHALVRGLIGVLEIVMTAGGLAALVGLVHPRSLRLGDLLAGTRSQLERVPRVDPAPAGMPPELEEWARSADVARLPDALGRRVAQFLRQAPAMTPESRDRLAHRLAAEAAPYVAPVPAVHPGVLLAGIAAERRRREAAALELRASRLAALAPALESRPPGFPRR